MFSSKPMVFSLERTSMYVVSTRQTQLRLCRLVHGLSHAFLSINLFCLSENSFFRWFILGFLFLYLLPTVINPSIASNQRLCGLYLFSHILSASISLYAPIFTASTANLSSAASMIVFNFRKISYFETRLKLCKCLSSSNDKFLPRPSLDFFPWAMPPRPCWTLKYPLFWILLPFEIHNFWERSL